MKKLALTAAFVAAAMTAPASAATIVGLYNTGVDDSGVKLADGVADTHYSVNGGNATVYTNGAYLNAGDAKFIAAQAGGGYLSPVNVYTLTFNLTGYKASTASISGFFAADNYGTVRLNGVELASQPAQTIYENFQSLTSFSASSNFLPGANVLTFEVTDTGPPSALLVSGLTGTAAVPEPATWAMMLLGFGMVGFGLRSRRRVTARVAFV